MIEGSRVRLRALRPEDYPKLTEFMNDVEFNLLKGALPRPTTSANLTEFLASMVASCMRATNTSTPGRTVGTPTWC